jgi:hypothetical protein
MLTIFSRSTSRYCDGVSRRSFLKLGAMTIGGLTLADLLRLEAAAGVGSSNKAIINVHLGGGPSHQDMWDIKSEAPAEFRGEFRAIPTNVSGMEICEHFPKLAQMADKFAVIRSVSGSAGQHSNYQTHSGYGSREMANVGGRPAIGSVAAKLLGPAPTGAPAFISYNGGSPGYLGPVYKPFQPSGGQLKLSSSLTAERLTDRTNLLGELDAFRREADATGQMEAFDSYTERAVGLVTSGKVADALDLSLEDSKNVARYGTQGKSFVTARRLVEVGVRVVTFNWGGWDTHGDNFTKLRTQLPQLDMALSSLVDDLHARGLDKDVTVIVWGEFGRTPRVNQKAGRDHWPKVMAAFLAGGNMRTGQVIGSTTKYAEEAKDRPVHVQEIFATLYRNLGIDVTHTTIQDPSGRPQYLTDIRTPVAELV